MAELAVIGCGYVGAVTAACFSHLGHTVLAIDLDERRVALLKQGQSPIHEPGLEELLASGLASGRLTFSAHYPETLAADVVFIAVDTPGSVEGAADLGAVRGAVAMLAPRLRPGTVLVNKSTVPVGTGDLVADLAARQGPAGTRVVSNPEFLREGSAVEDFLHPDRVILGSDDASAIERVADLYAGIETDFLRVDTRTAETIKYASNAFLATKISFINEMAAVCEALGADVSAVADGIRMDQRIGRQFLSAGLGWGGNCFPKDVRALAHMAAVHGTHPQLLRSVMAINADQRLRTVQKLRSALDGNLEGKRLFVLGAAFKGGTDDIRQSPAIDVMRLLVIEGASVVVLDPVVNPEALKAVLPDVQICHDPVQGAQDADALVLVTDWPEFQHLPYAEMRRNSRGSTFLDARNYLDPEAIRRAGFSYLCLGRPNVEGGPMDDGALTPALATGGRFS